MSIQKNKHDKYGWKAMEMASEIKETVHKEFKRIDEARALQLFNKFIGNL